VSQKYHDTIRETVFLFQWNAHCFVQASFTATVRGEVLREPSEKYADFRLIDDVVGQRNFVCVSTKAEVILCG
jgi:hypothetical protein